MKEDQFQQMMDDVDPSRDVTDATLDALVPHEHLLQRITATLEEESHVAHKRVPLWRRGPALVGEGAAALAVVFAGAMTLLGSTPTATSWSFDSPLPASVVHSTSTPDAYSTSASYLSSIKGLPVPPVSERQSHALVSSTDVVNGRFVTTISLDHGALIITPAPPSITTGMPVSSEAANIWATSQLEGYRQQVIGFGLATLTSHNASIHGFKNVPSFIALATSRGEVFHCPSMSANGKTVLKPSSNGEAAVVVATPGGFVQIGLHSYQGGIAYIAASAPCGSLVKPRLTYATEQLSLPWNQTGLIKHGQMPIVVWSPACGGNVTGYSVSGDTKSLLVTVKGSVGEGLFDLMCPIGPMVHEVIRLVPTGGKSVVPLVKPTTKIVHARTGPILAAQP